MLNFFRRSPANFEVNLTESDISFNVKRGDSLLSSALGAGVPWPFKCKVGSCGKCKCRLVDGKIKPQLDFGYVLDISEINEGYILACQSVPKSDITVSVNLNENKVSRK
ncbi:MAG: 2Fe-2S iron-sulfur cluster binding domain-containing protein [Porticoccaceae bacterium]|nr:2Fe-2S iron-sulfur cluster binding domain-containing protein [Porticoccaceae bacterium]